MGEELLTVTEAAALLKVAPDVIPLLRSMGLPFVAGVRIFYPRIAVMTWAHQRFAHHGVPVVQLPQYWATTGLGRWLPYSLFVERIKKSVWVQENAGWRYLPHQKIWHRVQDVVADLIAEHHARQQRYCLRCGTRSAEPQQPYCRLCRLEQKKVWTPPAPWTLEGEGWSQLELWSRTVEPLEWTPEEWIKATALETTWDTQGTMALGALYAARRRRGSDRTAAPLLQRRLWERWVESWEDNEEDPVTFSARLPRLRGALARGEWDLWEDLWSEGLYDALEIGLHGPRLIRAWERIAESPVPRENTEWTQLSP